MPPREFPPVTLPRRAFPASTATIAASARSRRTMCPTPAPRARCTAISRPRPITLVSMRLAMLEQAMSRTKPAATDGDQAPNASLFPEDQITCSGRTLGRHISDSFLDGYSSRQMAGDPSCLRIRLPLRDAPGLRRANEVSRYEARDSSPVTPNGAQISLGVPLVARTTGPAGENSDRRCMRLAVEQDRAAR